MSSTFQQENKFIVKDTVTREDSKESSNHWTTTQDQANSKDPKALAIMDLKDLQKQVDKKIKSLNETRIKFKNDLELYNSDLRKMERLFLGITVVVAVTFIVGFYQIALDKIGEKELLLNYDNLYQQYSDKNSALKETINKQIIEINNLKNQLDLLKAKNYLR